LSSQSSRAGRAERQEVLAGDGVFVFPPDEASVHEQVEAGWKRLILCLIQANRANVLLAAPHQLLFLLALRLLAPDGHCRGHQDGHHRQHHEERGHRVAPLATSALTL